jgi:hypothetical protein
MATVLLTNVAGYVRVIHAFLPLGTDAIITFALGSPNMRTGAFRDRGGALPW